MITIVVLTQGLGFVQRSIDSFAEAKRLRQVLGTHRNYVVYDSRFPWTVRLTCQAIHEFLNGDEIKVIA